jgi:hypothetical protein
MTRYLTAALLVIGLVGPAGAQSARPVPRLADGHPDFNGYWKGMRDTVPVGNIAKDLPGLKLPLTPAGEAAWKHNTTVTIDPESLCIQGGIPRHNASGLPFEILQHPKTIAFLYFYNYFRRIPVDANRKHADDPDPSFFGEELGKWDGDTLVIDTIGFNGRTRLDTIGHPHSDQMHVVERLQVKDPDHLTYEVTVDDPKMYTKPWKNTRTFWRMKPGQELIEYSCEENNRDFTEGHIK